MNIKPRTLEEMTRDELFSAKERTRLLEQRELEIEKLNFKAGDVVYHRDYGNCLIVCEYVPSMIQDTGGFMSDDLTKALELGENAYKIIDYTGRCDTVQEKELVPYSKISETLYEKI